MKIIIAGASGFVGAALIPKLEREGHRIVRLVRGPVTDPAAEISWKPEAGRLDARLLEGCDVVIHLGGENIAAGRWTGDRKSRLRDSRIKSTRLLAESLARMTLKPRVFLCASAVESTETVAPNS